MSHPVLWPKKIFFYPIGNTPPVSLTDGLAPEENGNILLLGCGDPRSILYTLYAGTKSPEKSRILDFTCCDYEPAIHARNALLFTMIVDGHPNSLIWNIFYHFKIDESSLSLLTKQCEKLISMSSDLDSWSAGPYSTFLRMCSHHTLSRLRDHWQLYANARNFSKAKNASLFSNFSREYQDRFEKDKTIPISPSRSAGPLCVYAVQLLSAHFTHYWRTGTVFTDNKDITAATVVNPTFIYSLSGENFAVHYGTYPLQCFHLAPVFARSGKDVEASDVVSYAQIQFKQWCTAFKVAVSSGSREPVTIRLFAGEALAFCRTIQHCHITSSTSAAMFISPWAGTELILDGGDYGVKQVAPTNFNVIDTSNLLDHVGLLNVFIACVPMLSHGPSSTLYLEALVIANEDPAKSFVKHWCAKITSMSLLLGITPTAYVSNFTPCSNIHEIMLLQFSHRQGLQSQYQERIALKTPYLGDAVALRECGESILYPSFEPRELASLLYDIYYNMFVDEDMEKMLRTLSFGESIVHYHRGTFAALLGLVKSKVQTDWDVTMEHLFDLLHADRKLIMGSNNYQDLCCQLYMRGIYNVDVFKVHPTELPASWSKSRFQGWGNVPPVVYLVLVVPREKFKVLEDMESNELGSPMFQIEVKSSSFHNIYSSFQALFGTIVVRGSGSDACATLQEDSAGWAGTSPLIVSVWMPPLNLALDPLSTQVCLGVHTTSHTALVLGPKLGPRLTLFGAALTDRKSVHILTHRPGHLGEPASFKVSMLHSPKAHMSASAVMKDATVLALRAKWEFMNTVGQIDPQMEVKYEQVSPCVMQVTVGDVSKKLVYPFPIDGEQSKLRIARKSGWVDISAPLSGYRISGGFASNKFPLVLSQDSTRPPTVWNIHQLNLERLPVVDVTAKLDWMNPHISLAFSDYETKLREQKGSSMGSLAQVKDSMHSLFLRAVELGAKRIFQLTRPTGGVYTIIFINQIRFDLASHTVVADTCILPLTPKLVKDHGQFLANIAGGGQSMHINTSAEEVVEWKRLLPVFVDRCRTWSHKPKTCEYFLTGKIPLSVEFEQSPICHCGEGVRLGAFDKVPKWKRLAPFVTRAAISTLFAVSYLEGVGERLKSIKDQLSAAAKGSDDSVCARCGKGGNESLKLLKCGRCKVTSYCGRECQTADWKRHKVQCKM